MAIDPEELPPEQQKRFERLAGGLIAPCCWSESARTHRSPAADEMRETLRLRIAEGWSDEEIVDAFVAEHGERVLAVPRGSRADALFWTPVVVSAVGLVIAVAVIVVLVRRRVSRRSPEPAASTGADVDEEDLEW
jgi:cytochrome c-type biogenesis protein CcmH